MPVEQGLGVDSPVRAGGQVDTGVEGVGSPDALGPRLEGEGLAMLTVKLLPGFVDGRLGVEDEPVEVETVSFRRWSA